MKFDPTYDYGSSDLTVEENNVYWKFGELITNLVTLSSPAERQVEIIGIGACTDEMAMDFETYFTLSFQQYCKYELMDSESLDKLKQLDSFFEERSGDKSPAFWDNSLLDTNPEWEIVREEAKTILEMMGMQDLRIEFERTEEYETIGSIKRITMQSTKTRLIRKNGG